MSSSILPVAVLGTGPLADRLGRRIDARPDLTFAGHFSSPQALPVEIGCACYTPALDTNGSDPTVLLHLLETGVHVVSAFPPAALGDIRAACHTGNSTFHATGFPSVLAARITRSLSEVTSEIRRVELEEELSLPPTGVYPWNSLARTGIGSHDTAQAKAAAAAVAGYYEAGLRVLDTAVFGATGADEQPTLSVRVRTTDDGTVDAIIIRRDLGKRLSYRSTWSARTESAVPLRYRFTTSTAAARGTTTVDFHDTEGVHPADQLTTVGLLDAVRPIHDSEPGIVHRDLSITALKPDPRL